MIDWYRHLFGKGWTLGLCNQPCGATAAGPPDFVWRTMAEHSRHHRPAGSVLTEYGMHTIGRGRPDRRAARVKPRRR